MVISSTYDNQWVITYGNLLFPMIRTKNPWGSLITKHRRKIL